jgi:hypothetical protein
LKGQDAPVTHGQAVPRSKRSLPVISAYQVVPADISQNNPIQQSNAQRSEHSVDEPRMISITE